MAHPELSERAQHLLKVLVERYIRDGQPVGSRTLARDAHMELSPATIRNVMADLEELGLISAPHTSAGRMPTVQGYRLFVDTLLTIKPLHEQEISSLKAQLGRDTEPKRIIAAASSLLSEVTALAGLVMLPRREQVALRQIEFLPLSGNRVLVILVVNEREVQNRIIDTSRAYSMVELQQAANYINERFAGRSLRALRDELLREMKADRESMDRLMRSALEMAEKVFGDTGESEDDYLLAGETNLMSYHEMSDMERLRQLFDAFGRKRDILHLLDQSIDAKGMQIFIGNESGHQALDTCSIVTAPYCLEGQVVGVLGVIGPTRMAYGRVIPIVDVTARLLGAALNHER
jgi:heat-inducible transcriptional repressor